MDTLPTTTTTGALDVTLKLTMGKQSTNPSILSILDILWVWHRLVVYRKPMDTSVSTVRGNT